MIVRYDDQPRFTKAAMGGKGALLRRNILTQELVGGRASMITAITLQPGETIGVHAHTDSGEMYYVMDGTLTIFEDGIAHRMEVGDVEFCADGHTHGAENRSSMPATILAVVIPDRREP